MMEIGEKEVNTNLGESDDGGDFGVPHGGGLERRRGKDEEEGKKKASKRREWQSFYFLLQVS